MEDQVGSHYSKKSGTHQDNYVKKRKKGPAYPLKQFHNQVKRELIQTFGYGAENLLDFACGRGGDLYKWTSVKSLRYVKGVDLSSGSVEEARSRYDSLKPNQKNFKADFEATPKLGTADCYYGKFDLVTCMFALHYFLKTEEMANQFFSNVSQNLKVGGYFIGCCPDGERVIRCLGNEDSVKHPFLEIKKKWTKVADYGCGYSISLADTVTSAADEGDANAEVNDDLVEYLVLPSVLLSLAHKHNLEPVINYSGEGRGRGGGGGGG
eukprot:CAMPEP_0201532948 /NCGR_PEP_ID=MMETSP0161_2-20130828/51720_1 /ASSEMBLY_ACC=CAM_ASM_000251 /TAXON_ID=180227 /ORGANISM="Neoparamoeba aestuarina, Strain SoJaBio B1-5/56/2" /LENGTH=265 /DNA_ID=CAMNT_0047936645 /DNA_START=159 /DNA_END=953 /DNA_ORIENTATION=-